MKKRGARIPRLFGKLPGRDDGELIRWGRGSDLRGGFAAWYSREHGDWCWQINDEIRHGRAGRLRLAVRLIEETVRGYGVRIRKTARVIARLEQQ